MTGPDWAVLVEVSENARSGFVSRNIHIFRKGSRGYRRTRESHRAQRLNRARVLEDLRTGGFTARTARRYGKYPLQSDRLLFIARRKA